MITLDVQIEIDIDRDVVYTAEPYHEAVMTGNPDNWCPAEGGEVFIDHVWTQFKGMNGNLVRVDILPIVDEDYLSEKIREHLSDRSERYD
jgi:hypothetical protein